MSAARWRRAMNGSAAAARGGRGSGVVPVPSLPRGAGAAAPAPAVAWWRRALSAIRLRHLLVLVFVVGYPFVATPFFTFQIGAQSLALGLIALSLTFLGGYGGMVSLAQMTVAGFAAYMLAIFGSSSNLAISLGWPWWLALVVAVALATVVAAGIGWLSVRTEASTRS